MVNPFAELWADPVTTLAAIAYVLLLASVSVALAGLLWSSILWVRNAWEYRYQSGKFGPQWELAPPMAVYARVAGVLFLGAVEALLIGGIAYVLT